MRTFKNIEDGRTHPRAAGRRIAAGLALAITVAAGAAHAGTPTSAPVSKCQDFGCQP